MKEKIKKLLSSHTAKGIAIASVALLIGLAVYLNYRWFYDPTSSLGYGENNMEDNYNDSQQTGSNQQTEEDYFAAVSLSRGQSRDEAIEVLKLVIENNEATEEARAEAAEKMSRIALDIQNEANIETLVIAKGFTQCVAVINGDACSIVVNGESLQPNQISQINEIVHEQAGISPANIRIITK